MSLHNDEDVRARLREALGPLAASVGFEPRVEVRLRQHSWHSRRVRSAVLSGALSIALVVALAGGFLFLHGTPSSNEHAAVGAALTAGVSAVPVAKGSTNDVWMTSTTVAPTMGSCTYSAPAFPALATPTTTPCQTVTERVDVLDWTGTLRYQFQLPERSTIIGQRLPAAIEAISPDGTRAPLDDGTVIDETGHTVTTLSSLSPVGVGGILMVEVQWLSNDTGVCVAGPTQVLNESIPGETPNQSDASLTLEVVKLNGEKTITATIATGEPSTDMAALGSTSVDACDPATDTAVVYHASGAPSATPSPSATASASASESASAGATPSAKASGVQVSQPQLDDAEVV